MPADSNDRVKMSVGTIIFAICMWSSAVAGIVGSHFNFVAVVQKEIAAIMPAVNANSRSIDRNAVNIRENRSDIKVLSRK